MAAVDGGGALLSGIVLPSAGLVWRPVLSPYLVYCAICTSYSILLLRLCLAATCKFRFRAIQWPVLPFAVAAAVLKFADLTPQHEFWLLLVGISCAEAPPVCSLYVFYRGRNAACGVRSGRLPFQLCILVGLSCHVS